jgi:hypothetical protein
MSLVSASSIIGGVKEYMFRGLQQLPIIFALTAFIFTITTASIAHSTLFLGLAIIMPLYTGLIQAILGKILKLLVPNQESSWTVATGDTCNIIPKHSQLTNLSYYTGAATHGSSVPSYWITSIGFVFGYVLMNAVETLQMPPAAGADQVAHEKRNTQAIFLLVAICLFFLIVIVCRFYFMKECEGRGSMGRVIGGLFGLSATGIGVGLYQLSRVCGARSSDLFGVLSQILPASATADNPVVCAEEPNRE